jgi:hypothetical protein
MIPTSPSTAITNAAKIRALNSLSVRGLASMFDDQNQLFCNRMVRTKKGLKRQGLSPRYTAMTLMGLHRGEAFGLRNPFNSEAILKRLLKDTKWLESIGDLGLLLWACALIAPERFEEVYHKLNVATAVDRDRLAIEEHTMEMAWFLAGLAHGALAGLKCIPGLEVLAERSYQAVCKNQGPKGIFGHRAWGKNSVAALRGRLGSFADQVYPIYALSKFGSAFAHDEALKRAQACAKTICSTQGPLGQWWWHYDSRGGCVAGKYPVYSVHQDAMAPMALFALSESCGQDYSAWVFKGLAWIYGQNELKFDLCDESAGIVWRCIYLPKPAAYVQQVASLFGCGPLSSMVPTRLRVRFEDRPYHFGWVLYAFASYGFQ